MPAVIGKRSPGGLIFDACNYGLFFLLSLTFIYPFWTIIMQSFSAAEDIYRLGFHLFPRRFSTEAWVYAVEEERVGLAYFNTIFRVVAGTAWAVFVTFTGAYALSKRDLPGRRVLTTIYVLTLFFNGGLIPTFLLVRGLGLINTRLILTIAMGSATVIGVNVFYVIIARNFLMTIDQAMEDSAVIDGAGYWRVLFRIMVPLSKPVIAVIALWNAVSYWNEWFHAMIFASKKHLQVLQMMVRELLFRARLIDQVDNFMARMMEDLGELGLARIPPESIQAATVLVTIGPIILLYPFVQKYFVKGVMLGSLKG
jgi:putative aldouronate transport system permease protein